MTKSKATGDRPKKGRKLTKQEERDLDNAARLLMRTGELPADDEPELPASAGIATG